MFRPDAPLVFFNEMLGKKEMLVTKRWLQLDNRNDANAHPWLMRWPLKSSVAHSPSSGRASFSSGPSFTSSPQIRIPLRLGSVFLHRPVRSVRPAHRPWRPPMRRKLLHPDEHLRFWHICAAHLCRALFHEADREAHLFHFTVGSYSLCLLACVTAEAVLAGS